MPSFSLADIQAAADKKFGPLVISLPDGDVTLQNPLRLSRAQRTKLEKLDEETDLEKRLIGAVTVAMSAAESKRLLAALDGDLAVLTQIVTEWQAASQLGEASPSPS